jgi:hypothetical protein
MDNNHDNNNDNNNNDNNNKNVINLLSYDLCNEIISYILYNNDKLTFYSLNKYTLQYKHDNYYYNFNVIYSLKYYNDDNYRNYIKNKINTIERMSLNYIKNDNIIDINRLNNVHALYLSKCSNITECYCINTSIIDCSFTSIEDLNMFSWNILHTLDLTGCDLSNHEDLSCLNGINNINLCKTNISNISSLSSSCIKNLNLSYNRLIKDFSNLGNIKNVLDLSYTNIKDKDLNDLCNIHTLILKSTDITNVSNLIHNTILDLSCTLITDISSLSINDSLYSLNISDTKVKNVNILSNIKTLKILILNNCRSIININELGKLHTIKLRSTNIKDDDILNLGNVHTLDISYCSNINDVNCLKNVKKLILNGNQNIDTSMLNKTSILYNTKNIVHNIEVEGNVD